MCSLRGPNKFERNFSTFSPFASTVKDINYLTTCYPCAGSFLTRNLASAKALLLRCIMMCPSSASTRSQEAKSPPPVARTILQTQKIPPLRFVPVEDEPWMINFIEMHIFLFPICHVFAGLWQPVKCNEIPINHSSHEKEQRQELKWRTPWGALRLGQCTAVVHTQPFRCQNFQC